MRGRLNLNPSLSCQQEQREVESSLGVVVVKGHFQSESFPFSRRRFCRFANMAKLWSFGIIFAIFVIIVLVILGESVSNGQRSRSKVIIKKKKTTTTTLPPTIKSPPPPPPPILVDASETLSISQIERTVESNVFVHAVTYTTGSSITRHGPTVSREEDSDSEHEVTFDRTENYLRSPVVTYSKAENRGSDVCPPKCDRDICLPTLPCPLGHVLDRCSCCHVCAMGEGGRCYNVTSLNSVKVSLEDGICGPGLVCHERLDLGPNEPPEALCVCRNTGYVCGNDNVTYSSECKLREAAHQKPGLVTAYWTPCVAAPWVTTAAENVTGAIGTDASISCEFRSFPSAVVHWEFSPEGSSERIILPGDDSSIIQTNRGGPEKMMTTSWIQIMALTPRRQGIYYCLAKNTEGMSQSYSFVSVYNQSNGVH